MDSEKMSYYSILGVSPNATLEQIKQAYRKKVSTTHPDVNKSANAHEEFIELNQAYECLIKEKSGYVFNNQNNRYTEAKSTYSNDNLREDARKRATENAKKEYEAFINSKYYKSQIVIFSLLDYLLLSFIFVVFSSIIALLVLTFEVPMMIMGLFLSFLFFPLFILTLRKTHRIHLKESMAAILKIMRFHKVQIFLLTLVNFFFFTKYAFVTFLPFKLIATLYLAPPIAVYILFIAIKRIKRKKKSTPKEKSPYADLIIWSLAPTLFSLFLWTNYTFSTNKRTETYHYVPASGKNSESLCELENFKYDQYGGIRFVFSNDQFYNNQYITYTIEEGFWGIDVLTDFAFSNKKMKS